MRKHVALVLVAGLLVGILGTEAFAQYGGGGGGRGTPLRCDVTDAHERDGDIIWLRLTCSSFRR
jgi:hypothetical protein